MFSQKKFLSLPKKQQHKKCAELLRALYETGDQELLTNYHTLQSWISGSELASPSLEAISDRYHYHLQQAGRSLREHNLLPHIQKRDRDIAENCWPINLYLDNIRSAHNVGSIIRTAEAFQFGTLYFGGMTPTPFLKGVQDSSMGSWKWVEWSKNEPPSGPLIGLETASMAPSLYDFLFPPSFTLVLGNEEYGISEKWLAKCDLLVRIPLRGRKNSLNVANAFALTAGQIAYQRYLKQKKKEGRR